MKSRNGVLPMLRAEEIESLRDASTDLLRPVIEYLLRDIAERVAKAGQLTATAQYETWKLQQLGVSQRDLRTYLKKALKVSNAKLRQLLTQSAEVGYNYDLSSLPTVRATPFEENEAVQQIVRAVIAQTQGTLENLTQTLGMVDPYGNVNPLRDTYRKCMDYAFEQVSSGAVDYNTAIREATRNLAAKGVEFIDYESGVTTSLEAAVRRNIMGALGLMQEQISQYNYDQYGATGWEIDAHSNSAPDHEPIQGKQYTDAEYEVLNNSLVRRIGTLNCGHSAHPIVYGASAPQYTPEELEEMRQKNEKGITFRGKHYTGYEATQRQRRLERAIRAQKRKILIDKATGDLEKLETDQIKLQLLQQDYKAFSKAAGLRTQHERLEKVGFAWKEATESRKVAESHYREWSKSIGADNSIKTLAEYYDVKYNDSPRYELLQRYAHDVDSGWISPLSRFDNYEALYNQIQTEIVGMAASNGVVITGQSQHFMQRVIGTMVDPQKLRDNLQIIRRSGVDIEEIKAAIFSPERVDLPVSRQDGMRSIRFIGETCAVTVNPDTGMLIQTNRIPEKRKQDA
nr:MAG TPA: minor capsid protein [Caudoviricetes sp.]